MNSFPTYGFTVLLIVDARFDYEYSGGHIRNAMNVHGIAEMQKLYTQFCTCSACIVFHCEFSRDRGPSLMMAFRSHDRSLHKYPELSYPALFLLEGGYRQFYNDCPDLCTGGYVAMRDSEFVESGAMRKSYSLYCAEMEKRRPIEPAPYVFPLIDSPVLELPDQ
jgi:M-phase inducer tyrosine phosphatase